MFGDPSNMSNLEKSGQVANLAHRMNWTMERMQKMQDSEHTLLMRVLFGMDSPTPLPANLEDPERSCGKITFFDPTLNDSQKDAVRFALASKDVALIHGPPGVRTSSIFFTKFPKSRLTVHTRRVKPTLSSSSFCNCSLATSAS